MHNFDSHQRIYKQFSKHTVKDVTASQEFQFKLRDFWPNVSGEMKVLLGHKVVFNLRSKLYVTNTCSHDDGTNSFV